MTFGSNVAPRRRVKPAPKPWRCGCLVYYGRLGPDVRLDQPAHMTRCDKCGAERPK